MFSVCSSFLLFVYLLFGLYIDTIYAAHVQNNECLAVSEGDVYFTVKLQDYTAVEKDSVVLECELSKEVEVMWYHNEKELKGSKKVSIRAEGKRRSLSIKRVEDQDKGQYMCDCGTDKTLASLNIEGNGKDGQLPGFNPTASVLLVCFFLRCLDISYNSLQSLITHNTRSTRRLF